MTLKSDAKFKVKRTFSFKHYMRNLVNFYSATKKSKNSTSRGSFCIKYITFELNKYIFHATEQ